MTAGLKASMLAMGLILYCDAQMVRRSYRAQLGLEVARSCIREDVGIADVSTILGLRLTWCYWENG